MTRSDPNPSSRLPAARSATPPAAALLLAFVLPAAAVAQPPPEVAAPEEAEMSPHGVAALPDPVYQTWLDVAYVPEERHVSGTLKLRWRNTASVPVPDLCFHHYLNAFSSNRTTFMRESGGQLRGDDFDGRRWGWIEVSSLRLPDGTDLKGAERYIAPDDGNPDDRTVALYDLPSPVLPGEWITVEADFEARLPAVFARTGAEEDYVLGGQWFPKIGVFEDRGDRGRDEPGWNCHQYHAHSEFFADFGDYDVKLTLPERYAGKIGATGRKVEESVEGGQVQARFLQQGVHDFAWTGDPDYAVVRDTFDPAADVPAGQRREIAALLGLPEEELALTPVEITLFIQPSHLEQQERYLEAAKSAIRGYGLRLGAYPYDTLTLVDPPKGAMGSAGMEYPTFITLGTHKLLAIPPFHQILAPEMVTVHEFGHQFFQGMIASNEFEESWIDEGINSYYEMVVMEEDYPPVMRFLGLSMSPFEQDHAAVAGGRYTDPVAAPSWGFLTSGSYGVNSYPRTAVTLRHLENLLGPETFHRAMRQFFQRYQFAHPTTDDFEAAIEEATGRDLQWFFRQALHSTRTLDYSVRTAESRRQVVDQGVSWRDGERDEPPDDTEKVDIWEEDEDPDAPYRSRVVVFRKGEFVHPVEVELRFEDGTRLRRSWDGRKRWARWTFTTDSRLVWAEVDPDGLLALDVDRLNNGRRVEPEPLPRIKLLADLLFWVQSLFAGGGLFS